MSSIPPSQLPALSHAPAPPSPPDGPTISDAHALVIGIARYQNLSSLKETPNAEDICAALVDPDCGGYPLASVHRLVDEQATRAAILEGLDRLARTTHAGSTVFLYYFGHGASASDVGDEDDDVYYLLPTDTAAGTREDLERTAISNLELSRRLAAIPAGRLTLVLDCCRAAGMATPQLARAVAPLALGRGRVVLAASRSTEEAFALPGRRNSTLTACLLDGLRGAAPSVAGVIRVCDLFHYVQQRVAGEPMEQYPVFKAELEENYPIAQLRGSAGPFVPPPPPDALVYDAFVSYCRDDADDRAWVTTVVVPYLEHLGLRLCLEHRDFRLGASRIDEVARAVSHSRYTIAVFSPAYIESAFDAYEYLLAAHVSVESRAPRLVPLIRRPCPLVLHARMVEALDVSLETEVPAALQRLALALRQPPRPRLDPSSSLSSGLSSGPPPA